MTKKSGESFLAFFVSWLGTPVPSSGLSRYFHGELRGKGGWRLQGEKIRRTSGKIMMKVLFYFFGIIFNKTSNLFQQQSVIEGKNLESDLAL